MKGNHSLARRKIAATARKSPGRLPVDQRILSSQPVHDGHQQLAVGLHQRVAFKEQGHGRYDDSYRDFAAAIFVATGVVVLTDPMTVPFTVTLWLCAAAMVGLGVFAEFPGDRS